MEDRLTNRVGAEVFQVSGLVSGYAYLNSFPFALNVNPGCFLHFLKSLGLFFSCGNAEAITSAFGMACGNGQLRRRVKRSENMKDLFDA